MSKTDSVQTISVIVPKNPFVKSELQKASHCLAALSVSKLMEWWPGTPHTPHRDPKKVKAIQRSLDWKRIANIAAYLLQKEIVEAPDLLNKYFRHIYEPRSSEPGREWPPKVARVVGFQRSEYPTFSNVLLHVNGAKVMRIRASGDNTGEAARLVFDENDPKLNFSVIDGQHRINGAYLALKILHEEQNNAEWDIPAEVFLDLDKMGDPPRQQAQIFIDVNFNQKKVDRSLVADLFPTARGSRGPLDSKERAQDLGRKLMLEMGPLVGMIQIPGIKYGVKDVVALATLNGAIEDVLKDMVFSGILSLEGQAEFLAECLEAWLDATGRREDISGNEKLDGHNVAYQGRVIVSFMALVPACIWKLKNDSIKLVSDEAKESLAKWLREVMKRAGILEDGKLLAKPTFKEKGFLGSGGIARFKDTLWAAAIGTADVTKLDPEELAKRAQKHRVQVELDLLGYP